MNTWYEKIKENVGAKLKTETSEKLGRFGTTGRKGIVNVIPYTAFLSQVFCAVSIINTVMKKPHPCGVDKMNYTPLSHTLVPI